MHPTRRLQRGTTYASTVLAALLLAAAPSGQALRKHDIGGDAAQRHLFNAMLAFWKREL